MTTDPAFAAMYSSVLKKLPNARFETLVCLSVIIADDNQLV
jgi:hypothetical protein